MAVAIAFLGLVVVARFPIWAEIDERPHYAYIQTIAEQHRLPLISDLVSPEVQAIADGTWPGPSPKSPKENGLGGRNYEAFQPPLYYLLATPAFVIAPDHRHKVFVLRGFNLLLIGIAGALLVWLSRVVAPKGRRSLVLSAGLLTLAWPGLLVRGITVSNAPLELVLVPAFLLIAWLAARDRSLNYLATAGLLLGLCLLTKLTLVMLIPTFIIAFIAVRQAAADRQGRSRAFIALLIPVLALFPWLISNHLRFGEWTANRLAQKQQTPYLYPGGLPDFGVNDLPKRLGVLLDGALPQEWDAQLNVWWIGIAARGVILLLLLMIAYAFRTASKGDRRLLAFFLAPLIVGVAVAVGTLLVADWDIFLLRYFQPLLPAIAVVAAAALSRTRIVWLQSAVTAFAVIVAALWVDMAGAFLFTDVGDLLGI